MFRPTRLAATIAAVLIPISVTTGSGAPPLPVSAHFGQAVPSVPATTTTGPLGVGTTWAAPSDSVLSAEARPALAGGGTVDATDIPLVALAAYQRATAVITTVQVDCGLSWELLAAIGRVESDHGRVGGATLNADGTSSPAVRGPVLDGQGSFAAVGDTDAGLYDGNARWDRAIGPMQFLPSTWTVVSVDADGDGVRSADDLDDAALGAAVYLCSGDEHLDTAAGAQAALLRYNHSTAYASRVLEVADAYRQGSASTSVEAIIARTHEATTHTEVGAHPTTQHGGTSTGVFVVAHPAGGHTPVKPSRPHSPHPHPTPADPGQQEPDPTPIDPTPSDPTPTDPVPEPDPTPVTLTGVLAVCADDVDAWCLDDTTLDLGDDAWLAAVAADDLDADGVVESNYEEVSGLVGTEVTLGVVPDSVPARVVSINGIAYGEE